MDVREQEMGILAMNLLGVPAVREMIEDHLQAFCPCPRHMGNPMCVELNEWPQGHRHGKS